MIGNIRESDLFNVTVHAGSLVSIICVNMRKQYMSTKRYPATLWLLPVLAFNAKFGLIV